MSVYEHNKGKLIPFKMNEDIARAIIEQNGGKDDWSDSYLEQLSHDPEFYGLSIVKIGGEWYKPLFEIKTSVLHGYVAVHTDEYGVIHFNTHHYTGAGHWTEVVEDALRKLSK